MNARLLKSLGIPVVISTMLLSYWAWLFRRAILVAFVAVQIWSLGGSFDWQVPAGMDVVSGPIPTGLRGVFWKAAAVLFVAMTLRGRQPGVAVTPTTPKSMAASLALLAAITAIFGLLLPASVLAHPISIVICLICGYDLLRTAKTVTADQDDSAPALNLAQQTGLVLSGIGVALGLQALYMRVGLWGLGEPAEKGLHAALFLGIAAFGAIAFASYLKGSATRRAVLAAGPLYLCVAVVASFALLAPLANAAGLEAVFGAFELDLSQIGQIKGLLLIGARGLLLPALVLGVLLASATRAHELRALGFGLALGVTLMPLVMAELQGTSILAPGGGLVRLAIVAASLPLVGWALVTFAGRGPMAGRQLLIAAGLLLPAAGLVLWLPKAPVKPLTPWVRFETEPSFMADTPHGLLTLEMTRQGMEVVTLDRYLMTPDFDSARSDQEQLRASLDYAAAARSTSGGAGQGPLRVLLAGQLTILRRELLEDWSRFSGLELEFDWTVPWYDDRERVAPYTPSYGGKPLAQALAPDQARANLDRGEYDLVVSLATYGPEIVALSAEAPPMAPGLLTGAGGRGDLGGNTLSIVWNDSRVPLSSSKLPQRALLAGTDLEHMAVGLITWPKGRGFDTGTFELGPPLPLEGSGLDRLRTRPELRAFGDRARLLARLAQTQAPGQGPFLEATRELLAAQGESSPWDEPDVRFEIDPDALLALVEATPAEPSTFQRMVWNNVARVLVAKRLPQVSYDVLPGLLAKTQGSWPEVEYSLSRAYQEFLMPEEAAELLAPLFEADQLNLVPLLEYAAAEGQSGNWARAAEVLAKALAEDPHNHGIERHLAIAELQSGNSAGADRIRHLMEDEPDDQAIQDLGVYLLPGPLPPAPMGFDPSPLGNHEEGDH